MTVGRYTEFLAACAAGGAIAPVAALAAIRASGRSLLDEVSDRDSSRMAAAANALAIAAFDPEVHAAPQGFDLYHCPSGQLYISSNGTAVMPLDTEVQIRDVDGVDVPATHYRRKAAESAIGRKE